MGGIKNKLSKLSNKVKTLFNKATNLPPLLGEADENRRFSIGGVNKQSKSVGLTNKLNPQSALTGCHDIVAHLASRCAPTRRATGTTPPLRKGTQDLLWDQRRQMKSDRISIGGFDRLARITKYTSLACLTLAILSTLVLNIVSSYSSFKVNSNAEPVTVNGTPTLANSSPCDPSINAPSCISLSITSSTGSNDPNLSLSIPQGGGIATGRHTVEIRSNSVTGITLAMNSATESANLIGSNNQNDDVITPVTTYWPERTKLSNVTYGFAVVHMGWTPASSGEGEQILDRNGNEFTPVDQSLDSLYEPSSPSIEATFSAIPTSNDSANSKLLQTTYATPIASGFGEIINLDIVYGVYVSNPVELMADDYSVNVVYSLIAEPLPAPQITSISPNSAQLDYETFPRATLTGNNFAGTYDGWIDLNDNGRYDENEQIGVYPDDLSSNTQLSIALPGKRDIPDLQAGSYTICIIAQGGTGCLDNAFTYTPALPDGMLQSTADYGSDGHVAVDYDENMIPITYTGNETTPKWVIADTSNTNSDTNLNWYDYPNKKWANAVTLTEEGLDKYKGQPVGTEIDEQYVLGYWVYIPRYAYKVMRKEVADKVVTDEVAKNNGKGGFEIIFETNDDIVKEPAICNNSNANQYYQDCIKSQYGEAGITYPGNNESLKNKTAWATHPAFTWQYTKDINGFDMTYELNGIWIGKFETTGSTEQPTVLPNQYPLTLVSKSAPTDNSHNIGDMYDIAKSVGIEDKYNKYGNTASTNQSNQNNNNLAISTSHMLKNSEWGAIAYLSSSKYGAGINNVQINSSNYEIKQGYATIYSSGITGCGPQDDANPLKYEIGPAGENNACSNIDRSYIGSIGTLASSTNNVHGIYDMNGGSWEYVVGSWTTSSDTSSKENFLYQASQPYTDLFPGKIFNALASYEYQNNDKCSWELCGGQAVFETKNHQTIYTGNLNSSWGGSYDSFANRSYSIGSTQHGKNWLARGGCRGNSYESSIYGQFGYSGASDASYSFRTALIALPDEPQN